MSVLRVSPRRSPERSAACVLGALLCGGIARAQGVDVEISGVDNELEDNVRAHLSIAEVAEQADDEEAGAPVDLSEERIRRLHDDARTQIVDAVRPFGYYEPSVLSSLEGSEDGWVARYEIERGTPTRVAELELSVVGVGRDAEEVREALTETMLGSGDVLRHQDYEAAKQGLFDAAYNAGFIDAEYRRAEFLVRPDTHEADVFLVLDTGPRYYFGRITVEQDILDPGFVRRFVPIEAGEPFSTNRLVELQLMLGDSGYFNEVSIEVMREAASNRRIPVRVHTSPRPNQEFTVGAGYGTDTGPRLRFGAELRRLNRRGHRFQFDSRISAIESTVAGEYRIPVRNPATDYISYRASLGMEEIGDLDTEQLVAGASWNVPWRGLQRRVYVEGRREEFRPPGGEARSGNALYPGITLSGQRADDPLLTREGYSWSVDIRASPAGLASTRFARLHLAGNYIHPLGERGRVLVRGEYGAIRAGRFDRLVPSQRFFAGGDRSVRGYEYQALGPTDGNGATVGGRYLLVGSVELDYLFVEDYGAAIFFDAGNAANEPFPDLKRSIGIGFRWRTPVGMLRIDFAHPLDDPETDFRLHLSIGASL